MTERDQNQIDELSEVVPERLRDEWRARLIVLVMRAERDAYQEGAEKVLAALEQQPVTI